METNTASLSKKSSFLSVVIGVISIIGALFHIFIAYNTSISVIHQRVFHVFLLILVFFLYQLQTSLQNKKKSKYFNFVAIIITLIVGSYFIFNTTVETMLNRGINGSSSMDIVMGVILILLVLELSRRTVGGALTVIGVIFICYALFGRYMPQIIAHKGYSIPYLTNYLTWTMEGIFGTPIGAAVSFIALYILFGELLDKFGAGKFFIDIAYALTGKMKGGPAEASVISSALMGSINGSAVANVVTTGTFTIPLMKKVGYSAKYAGAVEAVASTGGQILPPVMGAAAFVMADMTGIPYSNIIIAALIPGLLYYLALGFCVYLEAGKLGLKAEPKEALPKIKEVLKEGWFYAIPIAVLLICLLALELSANYSAIFAIIALLVVGITNEIVKEKKFPWKKIYEAFLTGTKTTVAVSVACAAAGIVIGVVSMTGIGVKFTRIVFELSGGNLLAMLVLIMLACIVMGMGLPSTAAYVIAATIGAPPLIQAGIPLLAAHMFVFYFAIISFITPPVALSAYAASGISGSKAGETGAQAFLLGISGFIIPYIYAFNPALLIVDSTIASVLYIAFISFIAILLISISVSGFLKEKIHLIFRVLLFIAAILISLQTAVWTDFVGIALGVITLAILVIKGRKVSG